MPLEIRLDKELYYFIFWSNFALIYFTNLRLWFRNRSTYVNKIYAPELFPIILQMFLLNQILYLCYKHFNRS